MVTARTDVDYKVPILFRPEPYDAWSWLTHVGERSMVIASEICDGDRLLARARVAMVFVDPATSRPQAPPAECASGCSRRPACDGSRPLRACSARESISAVSHLRKRAESASDWRL